MRIVYKHNLHYLTWHRHNHRFARKHGAFGCILGLCVVPFYFLYAIVVLIDRIGVSIANNAFGCQWLYFIDRSTGAKVYRDMSTLTSSAQPVSDVYVKYIQEARQFAIEAREVFDSSGPTFPEEHWHWREVDISTLTSRVESVGKFNLSQEEFKTLVDRLNWAKTRMDKISFNRFCLFIGEALRGRFEHKRGGRISCSIKDAVDCYRA